MLSRSWQCGVVVIYVFLQISEGSEKGLYTSADNVTVFNGDNLLSTLTTSPTLWLVEYYSSWCGHCQEFAPIFKALAKDIAEWHLLLKVGVINCPDQSNIKMCRSKNIEGFPTMRFYKSRSNASEPGMTYEGGQEIKQMRKFIVDYIEQNIETVEWDYQPQKPVLKASRYDEVMNFLSHLPKQTFHTALVFEKEDSYLGREVILDTSSCSNLMVRRVNAGSQDGLKLMAEFNIDSSELPQTFVMANNGSTFPINVKHKTRYFYAYQLTRLPGVGEPVARSDELELDAGTYGNDQQVAVDFKTVDRNKVYLADIESAVRYALTMEVSAVKVIEGKKLEALRSFIGAFKQIGSFMPGRETTVTFLSELSDWLQLQYSIGYETWAGRIKKETTSSHLPPTNRLWVGCQPSKPTLRRYPCSLWTLFHTMTVAAYNAKIPDKALVPKAMAGYITNFFGCRECRVNFKKEIKQMPYKDTPEPHSAIVWLWKVHNSVNKRLHLNSTTEDPEFPKIQFPPSDACPLCYSPQHGWNEEAVAEYLIGRYSASNVCNEYLDLNSVPVTGDKPKISGRKLSPGETWIKRLQNAKYGHAEAAPREKFHPKGLWGNNVNRRGTGYFAGTLRLQMGFSSMDMNLCLVVWLVSVLGSFCLYCGYRARKRLFLRKKSYRHLL